MAFNKASMVLLVLFAVATMASARLHPSAAPFLRGSGSNLGTSFSCDCVDEDSETKCYMSASSGGGICPVWCRGLCACTLIYPPELSICVCSIQVESCGEVLKNTGVSPKNRIESSV